MPLPPPAFGKKIPTTLFSLPGFLGHPTDWQGLLPANELWQHVPCHYYGGQLPPPAAGLRAWADTFNRTMMARGEENRLLMGYSLGGRLALHALCRAPQLWQAAVIISAHPGFSAQERAVRLYSDELWAQRFEKEPLDTVLQAWNSQTLFDGTPFPALRPSDAYDRGLLAATMRSWSLSKQLDLTEQIATLPMPILWLVGSRDSRYHDLKHTLRFQHKLSRVETIDDAGHRLPWQQPEAFLAALNHFCRQIQPEFCSI